VAEYNKYALHSLPCYLLMTR